MQEEQSSENENHQQNEKLNISYEEEKGLKIQTSLSCEKLQKKSSKNITKTLKFFNKKKGINLLIITIILITYNIIDRIYHKKMLNQSIKISFQFQKKNLDFISYFFSEIFFYILFLYIGIAPYFRKKKDKLFLYNFELYFSVYMQSLLKMIYRDGRPSFFSEELREDGLFCEREYGQPSGHTFLSFLMIFIIFSDLTSKMKGFKKWFLFFFLLIFAIFVSLSRIYFGIHSYNQLIMGIIWAVTIFFFFEFFENIIFLFFIHPFIYKSKYPNRKKYLFIFLTINLILLIILLIVFFISKSKENDNFEKSIIHCKSVLKKYPNFSYRLLGYASMLYYSFGYFLGIFLYPFDYFNFAIFCFDKNKLKIFFRFFIFVLINLLVFLNADPKINEGKYFVLNVFRNFIVHILVGFFSTYFLYYIFKVTKIGFKKDLKEKNVGN